jgi:hypothetical protein
MLRVRNGALGATNLTDGRWRKACEPQEGMFSFFMNEIPYLQVKPLKRAHAEETEVTGLPGSPKSEATVAGSEAPGLPGADERRPRVSTRAATANVTVPVIIG